MFKILILCFFFQAITLVSLNFPPLTVFYPFSVVHIYCVLFKHQQLENRHKMKEIMHAASVKHYKHKICQLRRIPGDPAS